MKFSHSSRRDYTIWGIGTHIQKSSQRHLKLIWTACKNALRNPAMSIMRLSWLLWEMAAMIITGFVSAFTTRASISALLRPHEIETRNRRGVGLDSPPHGNRLNRQGKRSRFHPRPPCCLPKLQRYWALWISAVPTRSLRNGHSLKFPHEKFTPCIKIFFCA